MTVRILILAALVVFAGCGGGGGGGSPADQASTGPGDTESFFPLAQGDVWTYDGTSSSALMAFVDSIRVTGTKNVQGRNATVLLEDNPLGSGMPVEDYYVKDGRAFTNLGNNDPTDFLTPGLVPLDEMRFPVALTSFVSLNKVGSSLGTDLDGDGKNDSFDVHAVVTLEAFEPLTTTAGHFSRTARIKTTVTGTLRLSSGGPALPISGSATEWRAPGVGLIKEMTSVTFDGQTDSDTLEVHGYRVGGVARGYLGTYQLAAGLATANSDGTLPGRPGVGSDGTRFLVVTRQQTGLQITSPIVKWIAQIVADDGTAQPPVDLSVPSTIGGFHAAVAFDGTNYLVVTDSSNGIFAQRVSTGGAVLDVSPGLSVAPAGVSPPAVAFGGSIYLVVYQKAGNAGDIYGSFVSPAGVVGAEFAISATPDNESNPTVAFDGANFLVAWEHRPIISDPSGADVYAARVTPAGVVLDHPAIPITTAAEAQATPQVACGGGNCLIIWVDRRNYPGQSYNFFPGPGDIYGARVSSEGSLLDGPPATGALAIATGITANAGDPGLAFLGPDYVVAWTRGAFVNNPGGPTGIYAARIATNGQVSPAAADAGIAISGPPASAARFFYPSAAASSTSTLVVWLNNTEVFGTTKDIRGAFAYPLADQ